LKFVIIIPKKIISNFQILNPKLVLTQKKKPIFPIPFKMSFRGGKSGFKADRDTQNAIFNRDFQSTDAPDGDSNAPHAHGADIKPNTTHKPHRGGNRPHHGDDKNN
jgi:hypothetical protein